MKTYKKKICFDLDGVICTTKKNFYHLSKPKKEVVHLINKLYNKNYFIIIFTSRFMGRSKENINLAKKRGYKFTYNQLKEWDVKFNLLIFGKPSFDYIIDDKSIFFKKKWYLNSFKNFL
jgi:hypothetical protein